MTTTILKRRFAAVADVMENLSKDIELLGAELCGDPELASRHMEALQAIDLIAQKQHAIAEWFRSDFQNADFNSILFDDIKDKLSLPDGAYNVSNNILPIYKI